MEATSVDYLPRLLKYSLTSEQYCELSSGLYTQTLIISAAEPAAIYDPSTIPVKKDTGQRRRYVFISVPPGCQD
jgi:hypothetical protein